PGKVDRSVQVSAAVLRCAEGEGRIEVTGRSLPVGELFELEGRGGSGPVDRFVVEGVAQVDDGCGRQVRRGLPGANRFPLTPPLSRREREFLRRRGRFAGRRDDR